MSPFPKLRRHQVPASPTGELEWSSVASFQRRARNDAKKEGQWTPLDDRNWAVIIAGSVLVALFYVAPHLLANLL